MISVAQYGFQILEENALHLVFSVIMLIFTVISLGAWLVISGKNAALPKENYYPLLWIALFAASIGTWFFTEAYVWAISAGTFAASGTLNYIALSLMPLSLLGILKSICTKKLASLQWIVLIEKIFVIAEWTLFLTGLLDFSGMLILLHSECIIAAAIFAVYVARKRELFLGGAVIRYSTWALQGTVVITVVSYFFGGNWLLWALGIALVILVWVILSAFMKLNREIKEIAQSKQYKEYALTDIMTGLKIRYAYTVFEAQQKMGASAENLHLIIFDIDKLKMTNFAVFLVFSKFEKVSK